MYKMFYSLKLDETKFPIFCTKAKLQNGFEFVLPISENCEVAKFQDDCRWVTTKIKKSEIFTITNLENFEIDTLFEYFKQYGKYALHFAMTGTFYNDSVLDYEFEYLIYGLGAKFGNSYLTDFQYFEKFETFNQKLVETIEKKFNTKMKISNDLELIETDNCYIVVKHLKVYPTEFSKHDGIKNKCYTNFYDAVENLYNRTTKRVFTEFVTLAQAIYELFGYEILAGYLQFIDVEYLKLKI